MGLLERTTSTSIMVTLMDLVSVICHETSTTHSCNQQQQQRGSPGTVRWERCKPTYLAQSCHLESSWTISLYPCVSGHADPRSFHAMFTLTNETTTMWTGLQKNERLCMRFGVSFCLVQASIRHHRRVIEKSIMITIICGGACGVSSSHDVACCRVVTRCLHLIEVYDIIIYLSLLWMVRPGKFSHEHIP